MHEIMHVLGFCHEQSREDRDHYVEISKEAMSLKDYAKEGIPLGDYDYYSIMHYSGGENMRSLIVLSGKMGQRDDFTERDVAAIRHVYSNNSCTYDSFKDDYYVQTYFECLTCWGPDSAYGVCIKCRFECHKGHELKEHSFEDLARVNIKFVCDCGRNKHKLDICTRISTKERSVRQMLCVCHDCFDVQEGGKKVGFCHPCLKNCHEGHTYEGIGVSKGRCECGPKDWRAGCKACLKD